MDGLRTARVLVVDDSAKEALPVIRALATHGIGALYLDGDPDVLPGRPLEGIRLLFADMELAGMREDYRATIGPLMTTLKAALDQNSRPLAVVTWTKHPELVDEFKAAFRSDFPGLQPIVIRRLDGKEELLEKRPQELLRDIFAELGGLDPLTLLWDWEQRVHDAATDTTNARRSRRSGGLR